jgi:hypothetical protein
MDILRLKGVYERMALIMVITTLAQVPYFVVGELYKAFGPYHHFYYPNGLMLLVWLLVIAVIYAPYAVQYQYCKEMIKVCVRTRHPSYDFEQNDGTVNVPKSLENSIGLKLGVYADTAKPKENEKD